MRTSRMKGRLFTERFVVRLARGEEDLTTNHRPVDWACKYGVQRRLASFRIGTTHIGATFDQELAQPPMTRETRDHLLPKGQPLDCLLGPT